MFISPNASRIRQKEAQKARDNRLEIVKALSLGEITRRDLFKWGIFTATGALALKTGLSPFAQSAYAAVPTSFPRSPLFGVSKFTQPLKRLRVQTPIPISPVARGVEIDARFTTGGEADARRLSYHDDFTKFMTQQGGGDPRNPNNPWKNLRTGVGPMEGRPQSEIFAHQRWSEFFPKVGYVMNLGSPGRTISNSVLYNNQGITSLTDRSLQDLGTPTPKCSFHPNLMLQEENRVWSYGAGQNGENNGVPFLIKARYGEPMITRIYNNLPTNRADNGGFGRNESQLHFHNAHNGAESDGAANVHHFPGTFYDYRWSTTLARRDKINIGATDLRASGPDGAGGLKRVAGDWRELQGTMWAHDHRFFFTAENVYKGNLGMITYYSGRDRGNETKNDGVNLRLPSGNKNDWGNIDFDVNLVFSDSTFDQNGQLIFDIFTSDGVVGDVPLVNMQYAPYMDVLPRKYRFRILNACMSRFFKLGLADQAGRPVPFKFIANDGNLLVNPVTMSTLEIQGIAERCDIVVDFSLFPVGSRIRFINQAHHTDGRMVDRELTLAAAIAGDTTDPMVGPVMEFRVASSVWSEDHGKPITLATEGKDVSVVPTVLTEQIPIVTPTRTRVVEFGRANGDSRGVNGQCTPDCPETASFPWTIKINGAASHSMNANRVSLLIPKAGEVEHWTYINAGSTWDHPIHLHFEEGVTMNRGTAAIGAYEKLARKDVWRLRPGGLVQFQIQFGEYGGSYVNHCHNTVHEDFAMLARIQLLTGVAGSPQTAITPTPNPSPEGVTFTTPEVLPEGVPPSTII
jgi:FtsP/CotA-like multicopper oxidase with cupredoxin domain